MIRNTDLTSERLLYWVEWVDRMYRRDFSFDPFLPIDSLIFDLGFRHKGVCIIFIILTTAYNAINSYEIATSDIVHLQIYPSSYVCALMLAKVVTHILIARPIV